MKIKFIAKFNDWQDSGDLYAGTGGFVITAPASNNTGTYLIAYGDAGGGTPAIQGNFGNPPFAITTGNEDANGYGNFEYAVPPGYYALCTKNLADVRIMAYTTIDKSDDYFNTVLYTGTGAQEMQLQVLVFILIGFGLKQEVMLTITCLWDRVRGAKVKD
jgi:hypothetical protein